MRKIRPLLCVLAASAAAALAVYVRAQKQPGADGTQVGANLCGLAAGLGIDAHTRRAHIADHAADDDVRVAAG